LPRSPGWKISHRAFAIAWQPAGKYHTGPALAGYPGHCGSLRGPVGRRRVAGRGLPSRPARRPGVIPPPSPRPYHSNPQRKHHPRPDARRIMNGEVARNIGSFSPGGAWSSRRTAPLALGRHEVNCSATRKVRSRILRSVGLGTRRFATEIGWRRLPTVLHGPGDPERRVSYGVRVTLLVLPQPSGKALGRYARPQPYWLD
jgi:hypothetical protein